MASYRQQLKNKFRRFVFSELPTREPLRDLLPDKAAAVVKKDDPPPRSRLISPDDETAMKLLAFRRASDPSILAELADPVKLLIFQNQAPGDGIMLSAAIRDLDNSYPGKFLIDVRTSYNELFMNNPHITPLEMNAPDVNRMRAHYSLYIRRSNQLPYHFIHGIRKDMETRLGLPIIAGDMLGDLHLSPEEKEMPSLIEQMTGKRQPFWIIDAGGKRDFTCKWWDPARYQAVVDAFPDITWVQIGAKGEPNRRHQHAILTGKNVIRLVGKTSLRQLMQLMWWSAGVITPVSMPMHMSPAIPMHPMYKRPSRPCIVIAGGREPPHWEAYPTHAFIHNCGKLECCLEGGCWKSRISKLGDGKRHDAPDKICRQAVKLKNGFTLAKCMAMITADDVIRHVREYTRLEI